MERYNVWMIEDDGNHVSKPMTTRLRFTGQAFSLETKATLRALTEAMVSVDASLEDDINNFARAADDVSDHVLRVIVGDDGKSSLDVKLPRGNLSDRQIKALCEGILQDRQQGHQKKMQIIYILLTAVVSVGGTLFVQWLRTKT